jgi:hypothetical protein
MAGTLHGGRVTIIAILLGFYVVGGLTGFALVLVCRG